MFQYKIAITNRDGSLKWVLPYESGSVTLVHNAICTAQVNVSYAYLEKSFKSQGIDILSFFKDGVKLAYFYEDDVLIFGGFIAQASIQNQGNSDTLTIDFKSWLAYFENVFYTGIFTDVDGGLIAWDVINNLNEIAITQGTITPSKIRTRPYTDESVAKILPALSSDNLIEGFDFSISPQKVLTVAPSIGSVLANVIFRLSNTNTYKLDIPLFGSVINKGKLYGGNVDGVQVLGNYDAGVIYKNGWFTQTEIIEDISLTEQDTVDDRIQKEIETNKLPVDVFSCTVQNSLPSPSSKTYGTGDTVTVKLENFDVVLTKRIKQKKINFGSDQNVELEFYK